MRAFCSSPSLSRGGGPIGDSRLVEGPVSFSSTMLRMVPLPKRAWGGTGVLRFAGYAAVFHHVDRGGDVISPGAFAGVTPVPLCWSHDPARPVGAIETLAEDARGLRVVARVTDAAAAAELAAARVTGLSIGYRVAAQAPRDDPRHGPGRTLTRLELVEISLVHQPMQPLARVLRVVRSSSPP